jgi:hypothetical protein
MFNCTLASVAGFHSFHSAYKHLWKVCLAYWMQALAQGQQRCFACQRMLQVQIGRPEEFAAPLTYPDNYRILLDCPACGSSTSSISALLTHPAISRFVEQHPRWHIGPEAALDYAGQPSIRTSLIDPTGAARLIVVAHRQTLRTLATFSE